MYSVNNMQKKTTAMVLACDNNGCEKTTTNCNERKRTWYKEERVDLTDTREMSPLGQQDCVAIKQLRQSRIECSGRESCHRPDPALVLEMGDIRGMLHCRQNNLEV